MMSEKMKMPVYPLLNRAEDNINAIKIMIEKNNSHGFIGVSRFF